MRHLEDGYGGGYQYCSDSVLFIVIIHFGINLELLILVEIWKIGLKC